MEDADEGADKVIRISFGVEIATGDSASDGGYEGGVDERAGAFHEPQRTARDGIHDRNDEHFTGDVVDEEKHPGAKRFKWRHGGSEALFGCGQLFDFVAVYSFDEVVASWEVAIEGGVADTGPACNVVEARRRAVAGENLFGHLKNALAIALRVGAGLAGRRGWREPLFLHPNLRLKLSATGDYPCLSYLYGEYPRFIERWSESQPDAP